MKQFTEYTHLFIALFLQDFSPVCNVLITGIIAASWYTKASCGKFVQLPHWSLPGLRSVHVMILFVVLQLVTSRQQCRDTEDRVVVLTDSQEALLAELRSAKELSATQSEAHQEMEVKIAELKQELVQAAESLGQAETRVDEANRAKLDLETQVADVSGQLNTAIAGRVELEKKLEVLN